MTLRLMPIRLIVTLTFIALFLIACGSKKSSSVATETDSQGGDVLEQNNSTSQVKILPLGDSITQGGSGFASYRRELWFLLQNAGYKVDFVGSQNSFFEGVSDTLKDFDLDHEGHWAWEAGEIERSLERWLDGYQFDIVLVHLGTNDFDRDQSHESTMQELESIIDKLRNRNPNVVIMLAKIIPMKTKDTQLLNEDIVILANTKSTQTSPIVIVDQYTGYLPLEDNHDNYHPNRKGESKIAQKWFDSLKPYLER